MSNNKTGFLDRFLSNISVKRKFILQTSLVAVGIIALAVVAARMQYLDIIQTRQDNLASDTEMAKGLVDRFAKMAKEGVLEEEQAKTQALAALASLQSNSGVDYFFVIDNKPNMLMHPFRADLTGKDVGPERSPDGKQLFVEMVEVARANPEGGYVDYHWAKSGHDKPVPKTTHVVEYAPWGWIIGTGTYIDDIQGQAWVFTGILTVVGGVLVLLNLITGLTIGRSILVPVEQTLTAVQAVSKGDMSHRATYSGSDEFGQMCSSINGMIDIQESFSSQVQELSKQHDQGKISYRMQTNDLPGVYGTLGEMVNSLIHQHIAVKLRVVEVMRRYASGDLSVDMDRLPGEKAAITQAMDAVKSNLGAFSGEVQRLAHASASGDFSVRGDEKRFSHDFRAMVQSLNTMMATADTNLSKLSDMLQAIARGDLTARMDGTFQGVFARMRDDANTTVEQLTNIIGKIQHSANAIQGSAGEIAAGNADLSRRTEQQAANLEETAASMEELTSTVRANADHARQANKLASEAVKVATEGGQVVGQVAQTVESIEQSAKQIVEILEIMNSIAFQTNLLSLNATVEAARAGEHGRGFAVVASEVRNLSQRSADAAKQIKNIIEESGGRIRAGVSLSRQAQDSMDGIVRSAHEVTQLIAEISAASQEQASGIEQVNQAVVQMDETTQQNAALVEEASAAASSMAQQAIDLTQAVSVFKTSKERGTFRR